MRLAFRLIVRRLLFAPTGTAERISGIPSRGRLTFSIRIHRLSKHADCMGQHLPAQKAREAFGYLGSGAGFSAGSGAGSSDFGSFSANASRIFLATWSEGTKSSVLFSSGTARSG